MNISAELVYPLAPALPCSMAQFLASPQAGAPLILSDLDGCLISGATVLPDVPELVERAGARLWVVSNNSADTALSLHDRLRGVGLNIAPERILLAGEYALRDLARRWPGAEVALWAAPPLVELARDLGLRPHRGARAAPIALLARDPDFSLRDLERLMRLAHGGTQVILANPDPIHPAADGTPVPETGALYAALQAGLPGLRAHSDGKPSDVMIRRALRQSGIAAGQAVFLGDTDATDGMAARAAGVPFVLLRRPGTPDKEKI